MTDKNPHVLLSIPTASRLVPLQTRLCLEHLWIPRPGGRSPYIEGKTDKTEGTEPHSVEDARTALARGALGIQGLTHVLMIDNDMTFQPDALYRLLDADRDVVGGLCFSRRQPYMPVIARLQPAELGLGEGALGWLYDYPRDEVIEVDRTGAAFLLVRIEVLQKLAEKHGIDDIWTHPRLESEDFAFCRKAQELGYKIHVDTGCKIGHITDDVVDEEFVARNRRERWQPWYDLKAIPADRPVATICIPTYNQKPKFLKGAVSTAACSQSVPVEVIVIDDGTTDYALVDADGGYFDVDDGNKRVDAAETEAKAAGRKVVRLPPGPRLLRQKNRGIAGALNTGIRNMTTEWWCWLSSDDLITPDKVERQMQELKQKGLLAGCHRYDIVGPDMDPLLSKIAVVPVWNSQLEARIALSRGCCINGSTVMIHKSVLDAVRLPNGDVVDDAYWYSQDYELWCRIAQKFEWCMTMEALGTKRMDDNLTTKLQKDEKQTRLWEEMDRKIHEKYGVKTCEHCGQYIG